MIVLFIVGKTKYCYYFTFMIKIMKYLWPSEKSLRNFKHRRGFY